MHNYNVSIGLTKDSTFSVPVATEENTQGSVNKAHSLLVYIHTHTVHHLPPTDTQNDPWILTLHLSTPSHHNCSDQRLQDITSHIDLQ